VTQLGDESEEALGHCTGPSVPGPKTFWDVHGGIRSGCGEIRG
jgi:hypothetical protein